MRRTGFLALLLVSCLPSRISGSSVPTEHTFRLTDGDLEAGASADCAQGWVTGDPEKDVKIARAMLDARGVKIVERNPGTTATALEHRLVVERGFGKKPLAAQAEIYSHELVHYCQRDAQGWIPFEEAYFTSDGRWRTEVPAYTQSFRTELLQGRPAAQVRKNIEGRLSSMRDGYWLWDINPEQYEAETRRIWESIEGL